MSVKTSTEILEEMEEMNPDAITLDGLDDCVIGICDTFEGTRLLYSERKIIDTLKKDGMTEEEAREYFDYNILGGYFGSCNPIYLMDLD